MIIDYRVFVNFLGSIMILFIINIIIYVILFLTSACLVIIDCYTLI